MNSKERVITAINHKETDRLPIDFAAREEIFTQLFAYFKTDDGKEVLDCLKVDIWPIVPQIKRCADPSIFYADPTVRVEKDSRGNQNVYYDIWGVGFVEKTIGGGRYVDLFTHPLKDKGTVDDIVKYPFPTADIWDYSSIREQVEQYRDYCVWIHSRGFFEISWFMRGMDMFMMDLMINEEYAQLLMDRIVEYLSDKTVRSLKAAGEGTIDFVEINDDVAGQNGLLISPELWRKFIKPRMAKMIKTFKAFDVYIRYHCCGGLREIIPDLIEIGVDILNPVQPLARGMNLTELKAEFGHKLTFNGGIDTQRLLPNGHGEEFERQVREILKMMGNSGGYIMAPSHALQGDVPLENIITLYRIAALPYEHI